MKRSRCKDVQVLQNHPISLSLSGDGVEILLSHFLVPVEKSEASPGVFVQPLDITVCAGMWAKLSLMVGPPLPATFDLLLLLTGHIQI